MSGYHIDWLLEFYVLRTSKVISGWVSTCDIVHSWWLYNAVQLGNQVASTLSWYPTKSPYPDTERTSAWLIRMPSAEATSINLYAIGLTQPGFKPISLKGSQMLISFSHPVWSLDIVPFIWALCHVVSCPSNINWTYALHAGLSQSTIRGWSVMKEISFLKIPDFYFYFRKMPIIMTAACFYICWCYQNIKKKKLNESSADLPFWEIGESEDCRF